jgi:hypothetical protein
MDSISNLNGKPIAANALPPGNDEAHCQSVASAIENLLQAAHGVKKRKVAEIIANNPRIHEIIEDEVIYPTVLLTGK